MPFALGFMLGDLSEGGKAAEPNNGVEIRWPELGGKSNRGNYPLPFVYLFGRADFTVSYFGANIYPENVSVGLEQPGLRDWVSGKFVLQVTETIDRDKALSVIIELGELALALRQETYRSAFCAWCSPHKSPH